MKKIVVLMMIISFVLIGTVSAQGMGFGVKGGVNMAKWTGEDVKELTDNGLDQKYLMGFAAGGFVTLPLGNTIAIRPEFLFSQNGAKFEGSDEGYEATMSMHMNWLNIPVLAVFNVGPVGVFAGPYFDLFLSGKEKIEVSYGGETYDEEEDIEREDIKTLNYGVVFGAAFGVTNNIDVELRYSQGLNSMDKEPDDYDDSWGPYEESDIKPSMIQALVNFYLKK